MTSADCLIQTEPEGYSIRLCSCQGGAYLGARKWGTPCCCERCGYMTKDQWDALASAALRLAKEDS